MKIVVRPLKLLLLASCVVMVHGHAYAQQDEEWGVMPTPDIVFDGSVLQELDPSAGQSTQSADLPAVTLTPPSSLNRVATPAMGSLTLDAFDPSAPVTKKTAEIKPIITTTPAPKAEQPAQKIVREALPTPKAEKAKEQKTAKAKPAEKPDAKLADIDVPARKPAVKSKEAVVAVVKEKPAAPPVVKVAAPKPVEIAQKAEPKIEAAAPVAEPIAVTPATPEIPPVAALLAAPAVVTPPAPTAKERHAAAEIAKEAVRPPRIGFVNPFVKAPKDDGKPVIFAVKEKTKTHGGLNPEQTITAEAPIAPDVTTVAALSDTMQERDPEKPFSWRQENPQPLYEAVPVPPKRPTNGLMASESFVQEARKNLVETYTIVKREGDQMPAVPKEKVARQDLPAPRLSVADIAGDPLASRIVNMSPEDVASALNNMAPAAGSAAMNLSRELNTVAKPRIVREMGEWNRKTAKSDAKEPEAARVEKVSLPAGEDRVPMENELLPPGVKKSAKSSGPAMITFATGEVTLSDEAADTISSDVVAAMKQTPNSRVQIVAYSTASDGKESSARRTSLSRALSVRSYLISQGIDATRMDVRAMGVPTAAADAADKVDMIVMNDKKPD